LVLGRKEGEIALCLLQTGRSYGACLDIDRVSYKQIAPNGANLTFWIPACAGMTYATIVGAVHEPPFFYPRAINCIAELMLSPINGASLFSGGIYSPLSAGGLNRRQ
jgi:hypothetical protein